jgi:hypothetical protein
MMPRILLVLGLLAATATAQSSWTLPQSHATQEGTSSTNVPFGRSTPTRVQLCYDPMLFAGPVTITEVAFRPDGGGSVAGKVVDCEIRMSTAQLPLAQMSVDFAQNRGADEVVVLPRQMLTLPASLQVNAPSACLPPIPLGSPFAYDPANGGLLIEITVFAQPPGTYSLDLTYVCTSPEVMIGPGSCLQSNGLPLRVESTTTQVMWGRPWISRVLDAPAGALVLFVIGMSEPGPVDLSVIGAPGCVLSIDAVASWVAITAADGTASFPFVLDNSPSALGDWIRFQGGVLDPTANPLGVVTSRAKKVQICGWEPVARVWSSGTTSATGTREIGVASVLQLTVQ